MLELFKTWASRLKGQKTPDHGTVDVKITREEMRDLFSDVLTPKPVARH